MRGRETLRPTAPGDEGRLKTLWKVCFGDEDTYIGHFFAKGYVPGQGLVLETGGEIASMLLPFSQEIVGPDGTAVPVWYVYAFCTHPDCRSRGFGQRLLAWTEERGTLLGKRGVVMVPGEESLFSFYRTLGYQTCFSTWEQVISRENQTALPQVAPCTLEEYRQLRARRLQGRWWVRYPGRSGTWQEALCWDSGGGLYRVGDGVAAVERWGGRDRRQGAALPLSGTVCPGPPGCSGRRAGPGARTGPGSGAETLWGGQMAGPCRPNLVAGRRWRLPGLCLRLTYRLMSTSPATHSSIPMT